MEALAAIKLACAGFPEITWQRLPESRLVVGACMACLTFVSYAILGHRFGFVILERI